MTDGHSTHGESNQMSEKIAVIGLGYVGLPIALAFGRAFDGVLGFDIDARRIETLRAGNDKQGEVSAEELEASRVHFTSDSADLTQANFYVVTVPTPIDDAHQPDLSLVRAACRTVGQSLSPGDVVVFESTVYPGVTREICGPLLAEVSGLRQGVGFKLGYSPERINPGDTEHRLESIAKVVSAEDDESLERVAAAYAAIISAGVHRAPSIEVAESAKVIENTQRDLNIALMNELAIIFDRLGVRTKDVLDAAGTKWNFLKFTPGLVGGHCIGVDPYYLTHKAESVGYHPQVILGGRRINDGMSRFVAQKLVKLLIGQGKRVNNARVGLLGLTFKANVRDIRNSRVPEIVEELNDFGIQCMVHDPLADAEDARKHYAIDLVDLDALSDLDALVVAVAHDSFREMGAAALAEMLQDNGVLVDIKSVLDPEDVAEPMVYWSL